MPRFRAASPYPGSTARARWKESRARSGRLSSRRSTPSELWYAGTESSSATASLNPLRAGPGWRWASDARPRSYAARAWSRWVCAREDREPAEHAAEPTSTSARQSQTPWRLDTPGLRHVPSLFVPTYEYECHACHRVFEVRQRISDAPLTTCDVCGGGIRRLLSPAPFILKGGGWYVPDYPSAARKKALESEKSGAGAKASTEKSSGEQSSTATAPSTTATPAATESSANSSTGSSSPGGSSSTGSSSTSTS